MDISSSTDSRTVQELCSSLSCVIMEVEIEMDSSKSHLKDLRDTIKYFKEVNDDVHLNRKEQRREDILCCQMVVENMLLQLRKVDAILSQLRTETDGNLNN